MRGPPPGQLASRARPHSGVTGTTILSQLSQSGALNPIWRSMVGNVATRVASQAVAAPASVPASWVSCAGSAQVDAYATTMAAEAGGSGAAASASSAVSVTGASVGAGAIAAGALFYLAATGARRARGAAITSP